MRVHLAHARLTAGVLFSLGLGLGACGTRPDADLFLSGGTLANGGAGNASGATAAPESGSSNGGAASAGKPEGEASTGNAEDSGGESSAPPNGGATNSAGAPASGASGAITNGGTHTGGGGGSLLDCTRFGAAASYSADTQHCYLVVHELATYSAAQAHCTSLGAHLVTLANAAEDQLVWALDPEEHWIGASDGNGPNDPNKGTFSWVTGEPFTYTNWSSGQPNTSDTNCGDSGLNGHCYEHCAFQWTGGEHDGQWNDRFCLHTIAAICEWDSAQ